MLWRSSSPMFGLSRDSPHTPFGGFAEFYESTHVQIDPKISANPVVGQNGFEGPCREGEASRTGASFEPAGMRYAPPFAPPSGKHAGARSASRANAGTSASPASCSRLMRSTTRCRPAGAMMPNSPRWPRSAFGRPTALQIACVSAASVLLQQEASFCRVSTVVVQRFCNPTAGVRIPHPVPT
jgi:hypothetical protein